MVPRLATPPWLLVMYITVFLSCSSFSIVLPALWPYLCRLGGDAGGLALLVSIYSVGEAVGALAFGAAAAAGAPTRSVLLAATAVGLAGSVLFVAAQGAAGRPAVALAALAAGRTAQGAMTGGMQAVQQHHLGAVVPAAALTAATVAINGAATPVGGD